MSPDKSGVSVGNTSKGQKGRAEEERDEGEKEEKGKQGLGSADIGVEPRTVVVERYPTLAAVTTMSSAFMCKSERPAIHYFRAEASQERLTERVSIVHGIHRGGSESALLERRIRI